MNREQAPAPHSEYNSAPDIFRISRPDPDDITDISSIEAIEPATRTDEPDRYPIDTISHDPTPSGDTSRRWVTVTKYADVTIAVELHPCE